MSSFLSDAASQNEAKVLAPDIERQPEKTFAILIVSAFCASGCNYMFDIDWSARPL